MQPVVINVDAPDRVLSDYGAGAVVRLERDSSSTFATATEITTIPVVTNIFQYEYGDSTGTGSDWYRTRYSTPTPAASTDYSEYSDPFQAGSSLSYASIDDLVETMPGVVDTGNRKDSRLLNLLSDLLVDATDLITQMCSRSFFRDPQVSGDSTWVLPIVNSRESSLSRAVDMPLDIISVTSLEIATDLTGSDYTTIALGDTGYFLDPRTAQTGWPYTDILLSRLGSAYTTFPSYGLARLVGARGWPAIPPLVKRATVDQARKWYQTQAAGDAPTGISALGQPIFGPQTPHTVRRVYELYRVQTFSYV